MPNLENFYEISEANLPGIKEFLAMFHEASSKKLKFRDPQFPPNSTSLFEYDGSRGFQLW